MHCCGLLVPVCLNVCPQQAPSPDKLPLGFLIGSNVRHGDARHSRLAPLQHQVPPHAPHWLVAGVSHRRGECLRNAFSTAALSSSGARERGCT